MRTKRGISPLISWVLIIGFAVAAGILITQWTIKLIDDTQFPEDKEAYCNDVQMEITNACINNGGDNITVTVLNEGSFSIKRVGFGRQTSAFSKEWCLMLLKEAQLGSPIIKPGASGDILFMAGSNNSNYNPLGDTNCQDLLGGLNLGTSGVHNLIEIEIVPWIKPGEEAFQCAEKGIILNTSDGINNDCP